MKPKIPVVDAFQIVGFVVSAAVSILMIATGQDTIPSVTLGLVLAALTQLFDLQLRHNESEVRLLKANALSQALYKDEWLLERIQKIVEDYQAIERSWFGLFHRKAKLAIEECSDVLNNMAQGNLMTQRETPFSLGAEAFNMAQQSLKVVTTMDISQWREPNPRTQKYLEAYTSAIQRGIDVKRVFVQPADKLKDVMDVLESQQSTGMEVYLVNTEDLPKELHEEYLIMDDRVISKLEYTADQRVRGELISVDPTEVAQIVRRFEVVLRYARKL